MGQWYAIDEIIWQDCLLQVMIIQLGDLYALGGAATFAISSVIIKHLQEIGSTSQLNFVRTFIGGILFPLHLILIGELAKLSTLSTIVNIYLALSVICNVVIGDTAFFEAQTKLGVKIATPLVNTYPYATIVFAVLLLDEVVTPSLIFGSLLLIPGVILLSLDKVVDENGIEITEIDAKERIVGLLLILLAVSAYTAGIIFTTIGTKNLGPIVANSIRLPVGTLALFFLASGMTFQKQRSLGWKQLTNRIRETSRFFKVILLIAGIFGTYLSSLFLVLAVQDIGASRSSILFSTGPFFALPLAIYWLKEQVGWKTIFGTILTVVGLWIIL